MKSSFFLFTFLFFSYSIFAQTTTDDLISDFIEEAVDKVIDDPLAHLHHKDRKQASEEKARLVEEAYKNAQNSGGISGNAETILSHIESMENDIQDLKDAKRNGVKKRDLSENLKTLRHDFIHRVNQTSHHVKNQLRGIDHWWQKTDYDNLDSNFLEKTIKKIDDDLFEEKTTSGSTVIPNSIIIPIWLKSAEKHFQKAATSHSLAEYNKGLNLLDGIDFQKNNRPEGFVYKVNLPERTPINTTQNLPICQFINLRGQIYKDYKDLRQERRNHFFNGEFKKTAQSIWKRMKYYPKIPTDKKEPSLGNSLIPICGSLNSRDYNLANDNYALALIDTAFAVSDVFSPLGKSFIAKHGYKYALKHADEFIKAATKDIVKGQLQEWMVKNPTTVILIHYYYERIKYGDKEALEKLLKLLKKKLIDEPSENSNESEHPYWQEKSTW